MAIGIKILKHKLFDLTIILSLLSFMLDSGGELGIRAVGFVLLSMLTLYNYRSVIFSVKELGIWIGIILLLLPSIFVSLSSNINFEIILVWIFPFLSFPLFLVIVRANKINERNLVCAGVIFSILIILIFLGRFFNIEKFVSLNGFLSENASGFFNEKAAYSEVVYPVVYFQGTLSLIICGVLAIARKNLIAFIFILIAVLVAPSRFGLAVLFLFGGVSYFYKYIILYKRLLISIFYVLIIPVIVYLNIEGKFSGGDDGLSIRYFHLESIISVFKDNMNYFITGNGPGSQFYTSAFNEMVDNIEVSQLELIRKYGVLFASAIFILYLFITKKLFQLSAIPLGLAMIAHFIVSISNPVLFSLPAIFLFSIALTRILNQNSKLGEDKITNSTQLNRMRIDGSY